jgi:Asp-tRNA(Asn)/Glu-tRNA(Gln) amidotransferase C subunit
MVNYDDIKKLASIAKLALTEAEAEDIRQYVSSAFLRADKSAALTFTGAEREEKTLSVADLREDVPVRETQPEKFYEQSPSEGGDGFTIRLLVE